MPSTSCITRHDPDSGCSRVARRPCLGDALEERSRTRPRGIGACERRTLAPGRRRRTELPTGKPLGRHPGGGAFLAHGRAPPGREWESRAGAQTAGGRGLCEYGSYGCAKQEPCHRHRPGRRAGGDARARVRVRPEHVAPGGSRAGARLPVVLFDHVGSGSSDLSAWSAERYSSMRRLRGGRAGNLPGAGPAATSRSSGTRSAR